MCITSARTRIDTNTTMAPTIIAISAMMSFLFRKKPMSPNNSAIRPNSNTPIAGFHIAIRPNTPVRIATNEVFFNTSSADIKMGTSCTDIKTTLDGLKVAKTYLKRLQTMRTGCRQMYSGVRVFAFK